MNSLELWMINQFENDPDKHFKEQPQYELWNTTAFFNCKFMLKYLVENKPESPYIDNYIIMMLGYIKHCLDNNLCFPWECIGGGLSKEDAKEEWSRIVASKY